MRDCGRLELSTLNWTIGYGILNVKVNALIDWNYGEVETTEVARQSYNGLVLYCETLLQKFYTNPANLHKLLV